MSRVDTDEAGRACREPSFRTGFAFLLLVLALAGCSGRYPATVSLPTGATALLLPGDRPLLTLQQRPVADASASRPVLCVQPTPDWVIAASRSAELSANGGGGGVSGGAKAAFSDAEAVTRLDGRTAGVVALRDGLYEACRAYTSGVIGQDAYALILSQYGDLLVRLAAPVAAGGSAPVAEEAGTKALLVACLSEADPTRLGGPGINPLLRDPDGEPSAACRQVVATAAAGEPAFPVASDARPPRVAAPRAGGR